MQAIVCNCADLLVCGYAGYLCKWIVNSNVNKTIAILMYELTGFPYEAIGTAGLIYFSVSEGKEAFEKAKGKSCSCCEHAAGC